MTIGVYSLQDLEAQRFASAASIGLNTINEVLQAQIAYDNARVAEMIADLAQPTTEQTAIWGTHTSGEMSQVDEYGHDLARKQLPGITAAFPMYKFAYELGWTANYFEQATGAEIAKMYLEARDAYLNSIKNAMLRAISRYTGFSHIDKLTNGVTIAVKRLWDNDAVVPPPSPAGATFLGTHDHYHTGTNPITNTSVQAAVDDVEHHGNTRGVKIFISLTNKVEFSALTSFTPLTMAYIERAAAADIQTTVRMPAGTDLENQLIGFWSGGEEVWVKPFVVAEYTIVVATGMQEKALMYRQRPNPRLQGLRIEAPLPDYPLYAQEAVAEFGFGVWNRGMAGFDFADAGAWVDMV